MAQLLLRSARSVRFISPSQAILFVLALSTLLTAVLAIPLPTRLGIGEGATASQTIRAPRAISFESATLTERRRNEAAAAVDNVLVQNTNVKTEQMNHLAAITQQITSIRQDERFTVSERRLLLERLLDHPLSLRSSVLVLDFSSEQWKVVTEEAQRVLSATLDEPIVPDRVSAVRDAVRSRISQSLSADQVLVVEELVRPLIVVNMQVDQQATEQARQKARADVAPVQVNLAPGQIIAAQGQPIDASTIEAIEAAGLLRQRLKAGELISATILSVISAGLIGLYLYLFQPRAVASERRMVLLVAIVAAWVLVARLYIPQVLPDSDRHFFAFLLPVAAAPMLIVTLLEVGIAILVAAILPLLITYASYYLTVTHGLTTESPLESLRLAVVFLVVGLVGAYSVHRADRVQRYLVAGVAISLVALLTLLAFWFLDPARQSLDIGWMALASGLNGLLAILITLGALIILGLVFGITTRFQLMELTQISYPLLRRLQEEAPGTFHHSVIVGNLAERAAHLIDADALLVRVGAYYHDIGKVARPSYYIENQMGGPNPHDAMEPATSARVIIDHVKNGQELARRYRLPSQVRDFIPQHHGTRMATYFYRKASQSDPEIDPAQFRYPGPVPQTRETAIVMLADSVEAVVRASQDHSTEAIDRLVDEIISERMSEGQLDECDLTMRDIRIIASSFKATLGGVYHPRIEYPAPTAAERTRSPVSIQALRRLPHRSGSESDKAVQKQ